MMVDMLVDGGCMHGREMTQMSRVTPNNLLVSSEDSILAGRLSQLVERRSLEGAGGALAGDRASLRPRASGNIRHGPSRRHWQAAAVPVAVAFKFHRDCTNPPSVAVSPMRLRFFQVTI